MRRSHGLFASMALLSLGCQQPPRDVRLTLELPRAIGCRPTAVDTITVRALGDFPNTEPTVVELDVEGGAQSIDRFPQGTLFVSVEGRGSIGPDAWTGGGVAPIGERSSEQLVTLLRYGRACPLPDSSARVPEGAAVAALSDGRLWVAGGNDGAIVREEVFTVRPGDVLATPIDVRLFVERTGATATALPGDLVVVAGGSSDVGGAGEDTLEIVSVREGEEARVGDGFLSSRRRDHAAIAIGDRSVLIAGGRERAGEAPLAELEVITIDDSGTSAESSMVGLLAIARAGATLLSLDDGRVAIAGGVDARGEPARLVEVFDPRTSMLSSLGELPGRLDAAFVALPGARVAQIGGRVEGAWTGLVDVLVGGEPIAVEPIDLIRRPRAVALVDGRVLVIGSDGSRARGAIVDVGSGEQQPFEASRAAAVLVPLADGSIVEGDEEGISALRVDLRTPFDAPPGTLFPSLMEDRAQLALDAPGRWRATRELIATTDGARFELPGLRFAAFELELDASGSLELLLVTGSSAPIAIGLSQAAIELDGCTVVRADGAPLHITRAADRLTIEAGAGATDCTIELPERVGIAVRAREGAGVRSLSIARR